MKRVRKKTIPRFVLKLHQFGSGNYVDEVYRLETLLAREPACIQIDLVGSGQMPPDTALLLRSVILNRDDKTHLITNARSSLCGASVLVWLLGDTRVIRSDARIFFQAQTSAPPLPESGEEDASWEDEDRMFDPFSDGGELDEADYRRVMQLINAFLPVQELAGRVVEVDELKQFGLVDSEEVDHLLSTAFARPESDQAKSAATPARKPAGESEKPKKV